LPKTEEFMYNKFKYPPNTIHLRAKERQRPLLPAVHGHWLKGQNKTTLFRSVKLGIGTLLIGAALFGASLVLRDGAEATGKSKEVFW
jgi:hypothetical protein